MKKVTIYEAFDGRQFESEAACTSYEAEHIEMQVVGLTAEQVRAALSREDVGLADALEKIGMLIRKRRVESGELRRLVRKAGPEDTAVAFDAEVKDEADFESGAV